MIKGKSQDGTVYIHLGCKDCDIQCCKDLKDSRVKSACYNLNGSKRWRESTLSKMKHFFKHFYVYSIPHYKEEVKRAIKQALLHFSSHCKTRMSLSGNFAKCGYIYGNDELKDDNLCPGCGKPIEVTNK